MRLPDYGAARKYYAQSYVLKFRGKRPQTGIYELAMLARIANICSNSEQARIYSEAGLHLLRQKRLNQVDLKIILLEERGKAYENESDIEIAEESYREALKISIENFGDNDARTGYAYYFLSRFHVFKIQNDSAFFLCKKAVEICRKREDQRLLVNYPEILNGLAYTLKNAKDNNPQKFDSLYPYVRSIYEEALTEDRSLYRFATAEMASVYQGLANTYADYLNSLFIENPERAFRYFELAKYYYLQALSVKKKLFGVHHRSIAVTFYTLALIHKNHPAIDVKKTGLYYFNCALAAVDSGFSEKSALSVPEKVNTPFPYYASVLIKNKCSLLDVLYKYSDSKDYLESIHQHNIYRIQLWNDMLLRFSSKELGAIVNLWSGTPFEEAVVSASRMFKLTSDQKYLECLHVIIEQSRSNDFMRSLIRSGNFKQENTGGYLRYTTIGQLQSNLLKNGQAFLSLMDMPSEWDTAAVALLVTRDTVLLYRIPTHTYKIDRVESFFHAMQMNDAALYQEHAVGLSKDILGPIWPVLKRDIRSLMISPSGRFERIPFEALIHPDERVKPASFRKLNYLVNSHIVTYNLGASILERQIKQERCNSSLLKVFTPSLTSMPRLLFSETLSDSLESCFKGHFLRGQLATKASFLQQSSEQEVLHISTHALCGNDTTPATLYFSGPLSESPLKVDEVYALDIKSSLTIIAACETGQGKQVYGEGSRSFSRAFSFAGSAATISTVWKVDEQATARILGVLYQELKHGMTSAASLRNAKLNYLRSCKADLEANPYYWAGLRYTGADRQLQLLHQHSWICLPPFGWFLCIVLMAVLFFIWSSRFFVRIRR